MHNNPLVPLHTPVSVPDNTSITMAFLTHRPCLWPLILFLCSTPVTSFRPIITTGPTTFWVDQTCIQKGFTPVAAQESLDMSFLGSRRLLNLNDQYQAWVYNLLFKQPRDFQLENDEFSNAWDVVGKRVAYLVHFHLGCSIAC